MKFVFIRHAESQGNKLNIMAGPEILLSPVGEVQAEEAALKFDTPIDVIYSSPWKRAMQTAEPFSRKLNLPVYAHDDIHEKEYGSFTGKHEREIIQAKAEHPEHFDPRWGWDYSPWGGESGLDAQKRLLRFIEEMKLKHADKTVLAVSHAGFIRVIHLTFGNYEQAHDMPIDNLSIHEFDL